MSRGERLYWTIGQAVVLLMILASVTFVSGYWAVLLALGPAAYLFVREPHSTDHSAMKIIFSYIPALVVGWTTYAAIAQGIRPLTVEPMSDQGIRIVGSLVIAFALTMCVLYFLNVYQPTAYVAAVTTGVGALPSLRSLAVGVITVILTAGLQWIRRRFGPDFGGSPKFLHGTVFSS